MHKPCRRILHVIGQLRPGGIETWLLNVMKDCKVLRDLSALCCVNPSWDGVYRAEFERLGMPIFVCPLNRVPLAFLRSFPTLVQREKFAIIHSHLAGLCGIVSCAAWLGGSVRRISHYHCVPLPWHQRIIHIRVWLRLVSGLERKYSTDVIGITRHVLEQTFGMNWQCDTRRKLIYYGIPLPEAGVDTVVPSLRQHLGIPPDVCVVGHVGRFEAQKNHQFIIDVAQHLVRLRSNIYFLLVGDGPLRETIQQEIQIRGLGHRVIFTGYRSDVLSLMRNAMDVFLFPSAFEGLGLVIIEAQAAGLRCLVSSAVPEEVSIIPEAVQFLPLSAGSEVWGAALETMLQRGRLHGPSALEQVRNSPFSMQTCIHQLCNLYEID